MISPINNSQHAAPASEAKNQPRKPKPQTQAPKSALSHDQVTLTKSRQVSREGKNR
jgi:hypothetical protein